MVIREQQKISILYTLRSICEALVETDPRSKLGARKHFTTRNVPHFHMSRYYTMPHESISTLIVENFYVYTYTFRNFISNIVKHDYRGHTA